MAEGEDEIVVCFSCGAPMNVASLPPYSRVACPTCGTENRVKKQFGPYVLNRRHAIGGMSSVFTATDETLGRDVALKILSEEYSKDEKRIAAFEEEARLTASFSHPNVVRVFTTGRAFGRFYIAMEFVPGGHFEHQIRERGRIPEKELLPLAIQVAEGLKGAQAAGLIHRDVKPGNILLDSEGNAKLVDFGLALVTKGGKAKASEIWATPYYVPPEAIEGEVEDFRSDIYAFGATFYHALAGKPPCDQETMATDVLREAKRKIVPLQRVAPDISDETCAVIDRAMAYEPAKRFSSYDEMISALRTAWKVANGETVGGSDGATKALRRLEARKRKQRNTMIAGVVTVVVAAIGTWVVVKAAGSSPEKPKAKALTVVATPENATDAAHRIADRYRSARAALQRGEHAIAEKRFADLLQDATVQEPTRTWSGLEAVVAAMMDGRMNNARSHAREVGNHIRKAPAGAAQGFREGVLPVLDRFSDAAFLVPDGLLQRGGAAEAQIGNLIAGLRNWEQGGFDQARPFLEAVSGQTSLAKDGVMGFYQKVAGVYLRDHDRLKSGAFEAAPKTPAECRQAIEELNRVLTLLETQGRARFNVRARQLDFAKRERELLDAPAPKVPKPDGLLDRLAALAGRYRFTEAVKLLSDLESDPPGCKRGALLIVSQASQLFLAAMESDLEKGAVNVSLKLRDGKEASSVVLSDGKLLCKLTDSQVREIAWTDLDPDQVLALHRALLARIVGETDRTRRIELSIAFDWLAGDRKRSLSSAASLAEGNESFRSRWEAVSAGLPK